VVGDSAPAAAAAGVEKPRRCGTGSHRPGRPAKMGSAPPRGGENDVDDDDLKNVGSDVDAADGGRGDEARRATNDARGAPRGRNAALHVEAARSAAILCVSRSVLCRRGGREEKKTRPPKSKNRIETFFPRFLEAKLLQKPFFL
jgi:hypothetical protein